MSFAELNGFLIAAHWHWVGPPGAAMKAEPWTFGDVEWWLSYLESFGCIPGALDAGEEGK